MFAGRGSEMQLKPLGDRIVVKVLTQEEKTKGGIVIPDTAKEKPQEGEVLAIGSGRVLENGQKLPLEVKKGDKILFSKYGGTEVKIEGEELLILSERDILAILEK
jgi:chaperonin GroES